MDYSACGYHASEIAIPDVRNAVFVGSDGADCYEKLQRAINYVSALKPDKNGHRGAVLLGEGTFRISKPLRISTSGVVIRGAGRGKTTIIKQGYDRGALLYIEGGMKMTGGDTIAVAGEKDHGRSHYADADICRQDAERQPYKNRKAVDKGMDSVALLQRLRRRTRLHRMETNRHRHNMGQNRQRR